jgi:threonyl-tRNA synthetase
LGLQNSYATEVQQKLFEAGMYVDIDVTGDTLSKKIRNAEIAQYNFIVGQYSTYCCSLSCADQRGRL